MMRRDDPLGESTYWRHNLRYVGLLLLVWFAVSYGAGILFVEELNRVRIPGTGFPLGFWFAQQGAIYVFVILIFLYVRLMNRLDREFHRSSGPPAARTRSEGLADRPPEGTRGEPERRSAEGGT